MPDAERRSFAAPSLCVTCNLVPIVHPAAEVAAREIAAQRVQFARENRWHSSRRKTFTSNIALDLACATMIGS